MQWKIPLFDSDIGQEEIHEVTNVLESKWLTMGEMTRQFEQNFCDVIGCKHAIMVSNGTTALHLADTVLNIGPGDEVIVPSLTFVATVNSVLYVGAKPVFADITSHENWNINPKDIERKITSKTKAIQLVHYGGYPCDMSEIMALAKKFNLYVIEDVAHAPMAKFNSQSCGTFGHCGCFSFFSNKNLATGEGGMVVTNDEDIEIQLRLLRSHGMTSLTLDRFKGHAYSYDVVRLGYNYRPSEITAAIGIVQLKRLKQKNEKRKQLVELYQELLSDVDEIKVPFINHNGESSYHIFPVLINRENSRQALMTFLKENGIQTSIHYPPVHSFLYYRKNYADKVDLPMTEYVAGREITLPLYPQMSDSDVKMVVDTIKSFLYSY